MKLIQTGPEKNNADELLEKIIMESSDLGVLRGCGISIAEKMNNLDALWSSGPIPIMGSDKIADAKNHRLEISKYCYLKIIGS